MSVLSVRDERRIGRPSRGRRSFFRNRQEKKKRCAGKKTLPSRLRSACVVGVAHSAPPFNALRAGGREIPDAEEEEQRRRRRWRQAEEWPNKKMKTTEKKPRLRLLSLSLLSLPSFLSSLSLPLPALTHRDRAPLCRRLASDGLSHAFPVDPGLAGAVLKPLADPEAAGRHRCGAAAASFGRGRPSRRPLCRGRRGLCGLCLCIWEARERTSEGGRRVERAKKRKKKKRPYLCCRESSLTTTGRRRRRANGIRNRDECKGRFRPFLYPRSQREQGGGPSCAARAGSRRVGLEREVEKGESCGGAVFSSIAFRQGSGKREGRRSFFFFFFRFFFCICKHSNFSHFSLHSFPYFSASTPTASATLPNPSLRSSSASRFFVLGTSAGPSYASAV